MPRCSRLKPYRQGQLDGLCGIYAIVNAIRLALGERGDQFSKEDWRELFCALLVGADEIVGTATVVGGIDTRPLAKLLKLVVRHMADEHEVALALIPASVKCDSWGLPGWGKSESLWRTEGGSPWLCRSLCARISTVPV
jgi:hypothetical protein